MSLHHCLRQSYAGSEMLMKAQDVAASEPKGSNLKGALTQHLSLLLFLFLGNIFCVSKSLE